VAHRDHAARLEAAEALRLAGEAQKSLDLLRGFPEPENPARLQAEAAAWLDRGRPKEAIALLEPLTRRAPKDGPAWLLLGRALSMEGSPASLQRALDALARAGAHLGRSAAVLYIVGRVAERKGDLQTAVQAYEEAVGIDPRYTHALRRLAEILQRQSRQNPDLSAPASRFRGLYERAESNPQGALEAFMQERQAAPHFLPAYLDAAQSWLDMDQPDEAIRILRAAVKIQPNAPEVWRRLALTCSDWNRPQEALAITRQLDAIAGPKVLGLVRYLEGRTYFKSGQTERATKAFRSAVAVNPNDANFRYWLGRALLEGTSDPQQAAAAAKQFEAAAQADPESSDYLVALGDSYLRAGQARAALAPLEQAIEQDPSRAEAYSLLSQALRKQGDAALATAAISLYGELDAAAKREKSLLRAVERGGKAPGPRLALAAFYMEQGDLQAARHTYLPAIRWGRPPADFVRKFREIEAIMDVPHE